MKVLVVELNSYHLELLPMYQSLLPSLFDNRRLDIHYFVLPGLVERAREVVGNQVFALNAPLPALFPAAEDPASCVLSLAHPAADCPTRAGGGRLQHH